MNEIREFEIKVKELIDELKSICANAGLGNDVAEFKIISQVFLYKFLNDKFIYELKKIDDRFNTSDFESILAKIDNDELDMIIGQIDENSAVINKEQLISSIYKRQNEDNFDKIFDSTLLKIAEDNKDIFNIMTQGGEKIQLFENISKYVADNRDDFCKSLVNKL